MKTGDYLIPYIFHHQACSGYNTMLLTGGLSLNDVFVKIFPVCPLASLTEF